MPRNLGSKVKALRKEKKITLKEFSKETGLSIGFLSQFERGLTTVALDSLMKVSNFLDVDISYFIPQKEINPSSVIRSYERKLLQVEDNRFIHYSMENGNKENELLPRIIEILPKLNLEDEEIEVYQHEGEEFVYVMEGILSLKLGGQIMTLSPGDSAHYKSNIPHNWENKTNRNVKILTVHTPNFHIK